MPSVTPSRPATTLFASPCDTSPGDIFRFPRLVSSCTVRSQSSWHGMKEPRNLGLSTQTHTLHTGHTQPREIGWDFRARPARTKNERAAPPRMYKIAHLSGNRLSRRFPLHSCSSHRPWRNGPARLAQEVAGICCYRSLIKQISDFGRDGRARRSFLFAREAGSNRGPDHGAVHESPWPKADNQNALTNVRFRG